MARAPKAYRVRFTLDPDATFEECNGSGEPLSEEAYAQNPYMEDGKPASYARYLAYWGNPDRHVYLQCEVEARCACCGAWEYVSGTGGIDFMDDSPEGNQTDVYFTPDQILTDRHLGYLREVALEDLTKAGWNAPRSLNCRRRGCKYWHVGPGQGDERYCAQHQPPCRFVKDEGGSWHCRTHGCTLIQTDKPERCASSRG